MDRVHIALGLLILLGVTLGFGGEWLSPLPGRAATRDAPRTAPTVSVPLGAAQTPDPAAAPAPPQPASPAPAPAPFPTPAAAAATLVGESAVVDNTEGLGLLLRRTADLNAEFVDSLLDGTRVEVLETTVLGDTRWYLVRFDDLRGWVRAQFLRRP